MRKPNDDVQDLKRRFLWIDRLGERALVCAEGAYLIEEVAVRDPEAAVAACRAGRPSLDGWKEGLAITGTPIVVNAAFLSTVQRDLRVIAGPRVASIVRSAGRMFRRHGDIDAAWIAGKQALLDALADAPRRAAAVDAGGGAFAPWFERALSIVALVRGEEAERYVRACAHEMASRIARDAVLARRPDGRASPSPSARERPSLGPRDRMERALDLLAHAALTFDPRPREPEAPGAPESPSRVLGAPPSPGGDPPSPDGADLPFPVDDPGFDLGALRTLRERYAGIDLRLGEALGLSRLKNVSSDDGLRLARLVAGGLPLRKVEAMAKMKRTDDLLAVSTGAEAASAYAEWILTLGPHYEKLGLSVPFTPELFRRLSTSRKSDLAVLAVCLLKHHSKAEPDTAEQALARLDATLALFARRPSDVSAILGELTGTSEGAGRAAMPEFADWLGDDALLDRYVHLSRLAGQPVALSRTLRADFDRRETLSRERAHLASLKSRSAVQEARLARLEEGQVEIPAPDRTRRRLGDRIRELLAQAYEARLDAVLRRIAREAWGIAVPRLTAGWRDAVRFYLTVEKNRELLATVLRTAASGADLARALPRNQAWIASVKGRFDVAAWLAPRSRDVQIGGERHLLSIERDPVEILRMGIPFDTCLSLEDGCNAASTVVNAADANKHVIYLRDARGNIVARKLVAVSREHTLIGYHLYIAKTERTAEITAAFQEMCGRLAEETGLPFGAGGKPKQIHPGFWYDDGVVPFQSSRATREPDIAGYCQLLGVPVPETAPEMLQIEARVHQLMALGDVDDLAAELRQNGDGVALREGAAWLASRLDEEGRVAEAQRNWSFAREILRAAAKDGYRSMLDLAGRIAGREGGADLSERVDEFPPSLDLGLAIVDAARAAHRTGRKFDHGGVEHLSFDVLPQIASYLPVAQGFALCDAASPVWEACERVAGGCKDCIVHARREMGRLIAKAYLLAPDPAAVLVRIEGRGTALSTDAAIALAARFGLSTDRGAAPARSGLPADRGAAPARSGLSTGGGAAPTARFDWHPRPCAAASRALARLSRRAASTDVRLFTAILRQSCGVPRDAEMPVLQHPPFDDLGDLLGKLEYRETACFPCEPAPRVDPDVSPLLARWTGADFDPAEWKPDPWELHHLRRTATPRRARIAELASEAAHSPNPKLDSAQEAAIHRLALLADVPLLERLATSLRGPAKAVGRRRAMLERATSLARELEGQMASAASPDPLSAEMDRRRSGRPKTNTQEQDRGLYTAALPTLDHHLASGAPGSGALASGAPGSGAPERGAPASGARESGSPENGALASGAPAEEPDERVLFAYRLILESERHLRTATEIAETLILLRDGRFSATDRGILDLWLTARRGQNVYDLPAPLAIRLMAEPSLRPAVLESIATTGLYQLEHWHRKLSALALAMDRADLAQGLLTDLLTTVFDRGDTKLSVFDEELTVREGTRLLASRGIAAPLVDSYRRTTEPRLLAAMLDELRRSPLIREEAFAAAVRVWRSAPEAAPAGTPASLQWLEHLLSLPDSPPPSRRPRPSKAKTPSKTPSKRPERARPLRSGSPSK